MKFTYTPHGVCSSLIEFELEGNTVHNVCFHHGCDGNLKGIAALSEGKKVDELISSLSGITCGYKDTSCPDQFSKALMAASNKINTDGGNSQ